MPMIPPMPPPARPIGMRNAAAAAAEGVEPAAEPPPTTAAGRAAAVLDIAAALPALPLHLTLPLPWSHNKA